MRAPLHEEPIGAHELGIFGVGVEPLEDVVAHARERRGRRVGAGQQVEGDLAHDDLVREVQGVLVGPQRREHVLRQLATGGSDRGATVERGANELVVEPGEAVRHLGALGVTVAGVVGERRSFDEEHEVAVQRARLVGRAEGALDAGGERGEVHHQAVPEIDEFGVAGRHVGGERRGDDRREQLTLVQLGGLAAEQPVLQPSPVTVGAVVQVHEHVAHDHLARVVQRLA